MRATVELPEASPQAEAASRELSRLIASRIREAGGWIGLDAYMAMALYEPGLGYYSGGSRKFGAGGDFITAPEICDLFGACLARQCAQWFADCPVRVIEFGAGSGALAVQVLGELQRLGFAHAEYLIIELSGELAARQRERIAAQLPQALPRVRWLQAWPERIEGVILANELLDAMPVRGFALTGPSADAAADPLTASQEADAEAADTEACRVLERGVALRPDGDPSAPAFTWALKPADARFAAMVLERLRDAGWPSLRLDPGRCHLGELGEQAQAWVREAARRLARGAMLLIDYGYASAELHHPQRSRGSLMCHYRHRAHDDPFLLPGLQDITAHVDFGAIAQAACAQGLQLLGFTSQARLLANLGLLEMLAQRHQALAAAGDPLAWPRQAQAAQMLLSEAEMGERFKAIALGRGLSSIPDGFARGDRTLQLEITA